MMTNKKILHILELYEAILWRYHPIKAVDEEVLWNDEYSVFIPKRKDEALAHILAMVLQTRKLIEQGHKQEAMKWLGFIQGVLWLSGRFSLEKIKIHNRKYVRDENPEDFKDLLYQ